MSNIPQTWAAYYGSAAYMELEQACFDRDGHACQLCGRNDLELVMHHKFYPEDAADDCLKNVITLCPGCHKRVHGIDKHEGITELLNDANFLVDKASLPLDEVYEIRIMAAQFLENKKYVKAAVEITSGDYNGHVYDWYLSYKDDYCKKKLQQNIIRLARLNDINTTELLHKFVNSPETALVGLKASATFIKNSGYNMPLLHNIIINGGTKE